jgi:Na+/H+ antiporter NhaC
MKLFHLFLLFVLSLQLSFAQTDSTEILNLDSSKVTVEFLGPKLDTIGISKFSVTTKKENQIYFISFSVKNKNSFTGRVFLNSEEKILSFKNGVAQLPFLPKYEGELLSIKSEDGKTKTSKLIHVTLKKDNSLRFIQIPLWVSIIPPLMAIILALIFRQVLLALFVGIFSGAWLANGMQLNPYGFMKSLFKVLDTYILHSLTDTGHLSVIVFSMMIGGVVALISRNGGMAGIVSKLSPFAKGPVSTQFVAWLLGVAIFFDDYANSLIVGNTMRPLTDKFKVSREKLSYIVDATAAPVAAVAFITTWIGAELGYIDDAIPNLKGIENPPSAYGIFLSSLPYSYYSFFTLIFMLFIIFTKRDFGLMYKAEKRARTTGKVFESDVDDIGGVDLEDMEPKQGIPLRWINGLLPILVVVGGTLLGLVDTGMSASYAKLIEKGVELNNNGWSEIWSKIALLEPTENVSFLRKLGILIGNSDSYSSLLWASLSAVIVSILMTLAQRLMSLEETLENTVKGFKTMLPALLILILAWALAKTTEELHTAEFLTSSLNGSISPYFLPVIIFLLAALISFSTGSSWSTMAILYPIAIPMTWEICIANGLSQEMTWALMYNNIAIVLSASVLGDHCSPISDTTILSSLASNCRHIDHVNTQLPYALVVGLVSIICGYTATAFGIPLLLNFALGVLVLFGVVMFFGKKVED